MVYLPAMAGSADSRCIVLTLELHHTVGCMQSDVPEAQYELAKYNVSFETIRDHSF